MELTFISQGPSCDDHLDERHERPSRRICQLVCNKHEMEEDGVLAFAVLIHYSALIDQQQNSPDRIPNVFNMQIDYGNVLRETAHKLIA